MNHSSLDKFKKKIEGEIEKYFCAVKEEGPLKKACLYSLSGKGKRLRPLLVLSVAEAVGKNWNVLPSAMAVEFFHTASLIVDDLPCMDDEAERREKPSLHRAFGENVALLASYSLISMGYENIGKNALFVKDSSFGKRLVLALEEASRAAGIGGATSGQFFDLNLSKPTFKRICQIIYQKTITLFEVSFLLGWIFGGGDLFYAKQIKKSAFHLGMAFQIADDLKDLDEDLKRKNLKNVAAFLGKKKAQDLVKKEISLFVSSLKEMNLFTNTFQEIAQHLSQTL
jgi:geranylgeranyl diphosphate synthase, type II